jgi:ribosomal-protein-alanine N-acetyltransferase
LEKEGHHMRVHHKMGKALLRSMLHDDLPRVLQIEQACFPDDPMKEDVIAVFVTFPNHVAAVVEHEGEIVAFMLLRKEHGVLHLDNIAVVPSQRRHGLAKKMLQYLQKDLASFKCKRICLSVHWKNEAAKKLYESFGFLQYGTVADAYHPGGHAILMHYSPEGVTGDLLSHFAL